MRPEDKKTKGIDINANKIKGVLLNFIVPLVSFGVTLLLVIFIVYPSLKRLPQIKSDLARKAGMKQTLNTKLQRLNRLVDFKSVVDEDSDLVNKVLVSEEEVPRLLDQINQIATDAGMSVTRLSYSYGNAGTSDKDQKKAYSSVTVSLGTDANYEQMILFMQSVEKAARFVSVPNFRYSTGTSTTGDKKLSASFSLDSPYLFVQSTASTDEPLELDISSQRFIDFINMIKELKYYEFLNPNIEVVKEELEVKTAPVPDGTTEGTVPASSQP